jgi:hypothetical protein
MGSTSAGILATSSDQVIATAPAMLDGVRSLTMSDPATGGSAIIPDALIQGASNDSLRLLTGSNPPTPAGMEAISPITVRVVGPDGLTPVAGASVTLRASPAANLSACSGASSCRVLSDEAGTVSTRITPPSAAVYAIDALLAPASYSPPKSVQATLSATSSSLDIAAVGGYRYVAEGASVDLPLSVRVVHNGLPVAAQAITFAITSGNGILISSTSTTDANGFARTTLQIRNLASLTQVNGCIAPAGAPCGTIRINKVALADIRVEPVAGSAQLVTVGQPFQPVIVRVIDAGTSPNPVEAAAVTFASAIFRPDVDVFNEPVSETGGGSNSMPVILDSSQITVASDTNGIASVAPSPGRVSGPVEIEIVAMAGPSASYVFELESMPAIANAQDQPASSSQISPLQVRKYVRRAPRPPRQADRLCLE